MAVDAVKTEAKAGNEPHCYQCDSPHLRRSHFRQTDVGELMRLHWPVRCRDCRERQFISMFQLSRVPREPHV